MISLSQIKIKLFSSKGKFKKGGLITNPDFFWNVLLSIFLVLVLASLIFGYLFFKKISNETFLEDNTIYKKVDTVSKERLDSILEYFSKRKSKSSDILNSPSPFVDPSI